MWKFWITLWCGPNNHTRPLEEVVSVRSQTNSRRTWSDFDPSHLPLTYHSFSFTLWFVDICWGWHLFFQLPSKYIITFIPQFIISPVVISSQWFCLRVLMSVQSFTFRSYTLYFRLSFCYAEQYRAIQHRATQDNAGQYRKKHFFAFFKHTENIQSKSINYSTCVWPNAILTSSDVVCICL